MRLLALVLLLLVSCVHASHCSSCRYAAYKCADDTDNNENASAAPPQPIAVCDAQGKIQVDDVFCDGTDCACADDHQCVSLSLGCKNLFQARNRRRCVSQAGMQERFKSCGGAGGALTAVDKVNLAKDWVFFRVAKKCTSNDCRAVRHFESCGLVQCGRLVVAWLEGGKYHFVVDGSRASDMQPGTFHFAGAMTGEKACEDVTSEKITGCYALQTRNQKNGTCEGVYLQVDQALQAQAQASDHKLADLPWPVWIAVVGSVIGAVASIAGVALFVLRSRQEVEIEEDSALLDADTSVSAAKDNANNAEGVTSEEGADTSPVATDLRQRGALPHL